MKVNWNDLRRPESSGSFPYGGGTITVRQEEIDVWRARPDALFTVRGFRLWTNKPQYVLAGGYKLPNEQREGGAAPTKVTWEDVGCPDGPGTYAFKDGTITVSQEELSIWIEHPGARFTVRRCLDATTENQQGDARHGQVVFGAVGVAWWWLLAWLVWRMI